MKKQGFFQPLDLETDNENEFVLPAMEKYDEAVKERDEKKEKRIEEEQEAKIRVVVYQTNVSTEEAIEELRLTNYDVIRAIERLVMP